MTGKKILSGLRKGLAWTTLAALCLSLVQTALSGQSLSQDWRTAARHSTGLAPAPGALKDIAIIQVYAAPTYGWRGVLAIHPWVIYKRAGETTYTRYEVIGWVRDNVVQRNYTTADGYWFGSTPRLLAEQRGPGVEAMIGRVESAIASYPWPHSYHAWPGPNSNTFMAHIGREVPELGLDLPANAIGKDYRALNGPAGLSPSGSGVQLSLLGVLGFNLGLRDGIEINLLGLGFGLDVDRPALRLPFVGRLGTSDSPDSLGKDAGPLASSAAGA